MLRSRVLAGLDRVRQRARSWAAPKCYPRSRTPSEHRERHTEGGGDGRRRQWHRAACRAGDGGGNGGGPVRLAQN